MKATETPTPTRPAEAADAPALDLACIEEAVARLGTDPEAAIPLLQAVQEHYRYLPEAALRRICEITKIRPSVLTGVATFYSEFRLKPVGEHLIQVCLGTACHVKQATLLYERFQRELHLEADGDTDEKGRFTIAKTACMGCCTLAPVVRIDGHTYGNVHADDVPTLLREAETAPAEAEQADRPPAPAEPSVASEIRVGLGSCCIAGGSGGVYETFDRSVRRLGIKARVKRVGCVGMCHQTPLVIVATPGRPEEVYTRVTETGVLPILERHFTPATRRRRWNASARRFLERLLTDEAEEERRPRRLDPEGAAALAFLGPQRHLATERCGELDPLDLDEYEGFGGLAAWRKAYSQHTPESLIATISESGLRGRGGAGFPTGRKWAAVRAAGGEPKYIICNGDEGDPGAFMDRMILESYPYRVIEGMAIAARAVGAAEGVFYVRAEYPLAVDRIRAAIERLEARGLLGDRILGTDNSLRLRVVRGAGAFVCGEESALIASIEGKRGHPTFRPPYPAERGFRDCPTLVNNVESYALIPWIIRNGPSAFAAIGTEQSKGTKVFALAGKIARGGLIEVPMGITIRQIVEEIGGGVAGGYQFKAVQIGGPSGGCIPASLADTPVDFERLAALGAMMGSGGLVVLDETDCIVDVARYFLQFTQDQSCGKCTPCRVGTRRMLEILEKICAGQGRKDDLVTLEEIARVTRQQSLCGLGRTAPNPVFTTLRYFREEYEAHLEGRCPAGRCRSLIRYRVTADCIGCTLCSQHCPVDAIPLTPYRPHVIDDTLCIRCDVCRQKCPVDAIEVN